MRVELTCLLFPISRVSYSYFDASISSSECTSILVSLNAKTTVSEVPVASLLHDLIFVGIHCLAKPKTS